MKLGKYDNLEEIGKGSFGVVYKARDTALDIDVALKLLKPGWMDDRKAVEMFYREARGAAKLEHPHIVHIRDVGEIEGRLFIVMQLVDGRALNDVIKQNGPMPLAQSLPIARQIADALAYAHAQGLIHRDIKPGNIIIRKDGRAMLTDFGLARGAEQASLMSSASVGSAVGTPAYVAPELWKGGAASAKSDAYAFACVVYEMLAGKALFSGSSGPEVMFKHFEPPKLETLPNPRVREALAAALAQEPQTRLDARELVAQLQAVLDGPAPAQKTVLADGASGVRKSKTRWGWALVPILAVVAIGAWLAGQIPPPKPAPTPTIVPTLAPKHTETAMPTEIPKVSPTPIYFEPPAAQFTTPVSSVLPTNSLTISPLVSSQATSNTIVLIDPSPKAIITNTNSSQVSFKWESSYSLGADETFVLALQAGKVENVFPTQAMSLTLRLGHSHYHWAVCVVKSVYVKPYNGCSTDLAIVVSEWRSIGIEYPPPLQQAASTPNSIPTPQLLSPATGAHFGGADAPVFNWSWSGTLAADEYYVFAARHEQGEDDTWTKDQTATAKPYLGQKGTKINSWAVCIAKMTKPVPMNVCGSKGALVISEWRPVSWEMPIIIPASQERTAPLPPPYRP